MTRHLLTAGLLLAMGLVLGPRPVEAQGPTIDSGTAPGPGSSSSSLGPSPGANTSMLGSAPGAGGASGGDQGAAPISGRPGPTVPRVPSSVSQPGGGGPQGMPDQRGISAPAAAPITEAPLYGSLAISSEVEDEGPPDALTLDMAIEQLLQDNLDLRSRFLEIPQAEADILTASLRANPIFYADSQLIPYGQYSPARPGGQLQYDVNVSYPLDVSRKRRARTLSAVRAKRVLEAQYQDAVRQQIDNLYTVYVDVLAARQRVRYAQASVKGTTQILETTRRLLGGGETTQADVNRLQIVRDKAVIGLVDAEATLKQAQRSLSTLLNMPPAQFESVQIRGTIFDRVPPPPPLEELVASGLNARPDVASYQLGIQRAESDVRLAKANRLQDIYVLYQPYTFQNNQPSGLKSATSWAIGVTVPLPIYNRNQGVIHRAQINVTQTKTQLEALKRQVISEVQKAEREYQVSRDAVIRIKADLLPRAEAVLRDSYRLYQGGEVNLISFLDARREYNETAQQYLDTVVRHRRSMLDLNTAVGQRILP
jgi:cobalt-zinc-cadmium efflux system outer membrane protein